MDIRKNEAAELAGRIRSWLLNAPVQAEAGVHRGGVAGWLDDRDRMEFIYGEITGYYLVWLAWMAGSSRLGAAAMEKVNAAAKWIGARNRNGAPAKTRNYLEAGAGDWRNRLYFSFDLAMMARGASLAPWEGDDHPAAAPLGVVRLLENCIDENGRLLPAIPADGAPTPTPRGWSTRPGPYQVKAAAAILSSGFTRGADRLRAAARSTITHWRNRHPPPAELLDQVHEFFRVRPDHDLNMTRPGQTLFDISINGLSGVREVLEKENPDLLMIQGDTTTAFAAALSAAYFHIPVAHVEAGLRTHRKSAPFPEEINRELIARLSSIISPPRKRPAGTC